MRIILNNIRSAWNVGAIMRTCDALGSDLTLIGYTPKPQGSTLKLVKKTAIGAEESVNWDHFEHSQEILQNPELNKNRINIALELSERSHQVYDFCNKILPEFLAKNENKEICLWFGNEIHGLDNQTLEEMDFTIFLPMNGIKESLNVASTVCAAGYLLLPFEELRENQKSF